MPKFVSDILAKAGLTVDGVVTLNNTATGQTADANDDSTKLATTAWVRTFVQPYSLPIASDSILGGIKVGSGLTIDPTTGVLTATGGGGSGSLNFKTIQEFTVTSTQDTFTINGGYSVGYIEVLINGVYLSESLYTATDGTTVVLDDAAVSGDIVTVFLYSLYNLGESSYARNVDTLIATEGQTIFSTSYIPGQIDVYYNGSKLTATEFTAINGSSIVLGQAAILGDIIEVVTYLAGAGVNSNRTITINGVSYDLSADRSWTIAGGVTSFNTRTGDITPASGDYTTAQVTESGNLYYTNARVRLAISLTTTGTSGAATYDNVTGVLNIPQYQGGVTSFNTRTGDITLSGSDVTTALTYTPVTNARTISINGTSYDLTADRSWTIAPDVSVRNTYAFTATAAQTTFTVTGGYSVGLVDVFINGVKLAAADFTATNGTTVVLGTGTGVGNIVEIVKYVSAFTTAQEALNGTGLVRMSGTTVSYDNATYATQSYVTTAVANLVNAAPSTLDTLNELATALGNDANFATTITTSIATKLALSGGTLTGALSGTSATFSSTIQSTGLTLLGPTGAGIGPSLTWDRSGGYGSFAATYIYENTYYTGGSTLEFKGGTLPVFRMVTNNAYTVAQVHFLGAATFSSSIQIGTTPATITAGLAIGIANDNAIRWRNAANTGNLGMYLSGGNQFVFDTSIYANGEITSTSHATFGATNSTANVRIYSNGAPLTIFGGTGYARGFMGLTWDVNPDRGLIIGNELRFNTNSIPGTTIGSTALTLASNQAASFSGSVNFNTQGNIVAKTSSVYNGTQTVTIGPGSYNGVMQIMVGVYGNGQGSQARAMWVCGGYIGSGIGFTEITRVNGGSITISALTANAGSCTFTVSYSFPNAADISVTVIGTNANTSPATITIA